MKPFFVAYTFFLVTGLITPLASATDRFVAVGGSGWDCDAHDPCGTIQEAIDLAGPDDTVHVAAGTYAENIDIPPGKDGLTLSGAGQHKTVLQSAGGLLNREAPAGVPIDAIVDVFSSRVTLRKMTLRHPQAEPDKRDIGVFVRPPALDTVIEKATIRRDRVGQLEPTTPGSRGVLVVRATGTTISRNRLRGNYEDHIHLPASNTTVIDNSVIDATRIGIVVIQETPDSQSTGNLIINNRVRRSGSDAIQIQGDGNLVLKNRLRHNAGAGIKLCGPQSVPACVAPGAQALASFNTVLQNTLSRNAGGAVVNNGSSTIIFDY